MAYTKTVWEDYPSEDTIIDADKLNNIEDAVEQLDSLIDVDGSNHTVIGANSVRATRYVPITPVTVVDNADPTQNQFWEDVDVTAITSANTYAVSGVSFVSSTAAQNVLYIRKNGGSGSGNITTAKNITQVANSASVCSFTVDVDEGQVFEWAVSSANVNSVYIVINGYWEYVD